MVAQLIVPTSNTSARFGDASIVRCMLFLWSHRYVGEGITMASLVVAVAAGFPFEILMGRMPVGLLAFHFKVSVVVRGIPCGGALVVRVLSMCGDPLNRDGFGEANVSRRWGMDRDQSFCFVLFRLWENLVVCVIIFVVGCMCDHFCRTCVFV